MTQNGKQGIFRGHGETVTVVLTVLGAVLTVALHLGGKIDDVDNKVDSLNREVGEISTQLENHNHTVDKHKDTSTSTASLPE